MEGKSEERQVIEQIQATRGQQKVCFVSGYFNIMHPGHLRLLSFAADLADILIVGVYKNPSATAAGFTEEQRLSVLRALRFVDHAFVLQGSLESFLRELKPDLVVKGKEFEDEENVEVKILQGYGGKLLFSSGNTGVSATDLLAASPLLQQQISYPQDFLERHKFELTEISPLLDAFLSLRVCVIGDVIVDEYVICDPLGMSQEDPSLVVRPVESHKFLGGAGIVAAHLAGLGATVNFLTVTGNDENAVFVRDNLLDYGVTPHVCIDETRPTTHKQRMQCQNKTLLRISHLHQHAISHDLARYLNLQFNDLINSVDLLVFSDFNYGCLPQYLVDRLLAQTARYRVPYVADSQSSSQVGDVSRFSGAVLLTPTEREARLATHDFESGLVVMAEKLRCQAKADHIAMTLGAAGVLLHSGVEGGSFLTDRICAMCTTPTDPAGAGDSFLAATALALRGGSDIWKAAFLGSVAAAIQVGRIGNIPVTREEIISAIAEARPSLPS